MLEQRLSIPQFSTYGVLEDLQVSSPSHRTVPYEIMPYDKHAQRKIERKLKLTFGSESLFVGKNLEKGLDLTSKRFEAVDHYINNRVEKFIIRNDEVNQELLNDEDFHAEHPHINNTKDLSTHMMRVAKTTHYTNEDGEYYLPFDDIRVNLGEQWGRIRFAWDTENNLHAILGSDLEEADKFNVAMGTMRNAFYTFKNRRFVPNGTKTGLDGHTQAPRHAEMVRTIAAAMTPEQRASNKEFFAEMDQFLLEEYWTVFYAKDPANPYSKKDPLHQNVIIKGKLFNRYGGKDHCNGKPYHWDAELSSGNDFTDRFEGRAADYQPIDLLMYLHDYERYFAEKAKAEQGESSDAATFWRAREKSTINRVIEHHVDRKRGFIYDYDIENDRLSPITALVGMLPYPDLPDTEHEVKQQMMQIFKSEFLDKSGLVLTLEKSHPKRPTSEDIVHLDKGTQLMIERHHRKKQWNGPNQFYNITSQAVDVLIRAEEYETAVDVIENAMIGMVQYFEKSREVTGSGKLPEKLNARTGEKGSGADYEDQDELVMPFGAFKKFKRLYPIVYELRNSRRQEIKVVSSNIFSRNSDPHRPMAA